MEILYMGTAADERIPAMFCNCELCQKSLKLGGKNIRTRAQALIDDELLVDFGCDTYDHFLKQGRTLWDIKNVLLTHSHPDHLTLEVFGPRCHWYSAQTTKHDAIYIYTSAGVIDKIWRVVEARGMEKELIEKYEQFDIILDDGSHFPHHQIASFKYLWDYITPNGIYMVEDIQSSYYLIYNSYALNKNSFIEYSKQAIEEINLYHQPERIGTKSKIPDLYGVYFHSIYF